MLSPSSFFDLEGFAHKELFEGVGMVWEVITRIGPWLEKNAPRGREILGRVMEGAWLEGEGIYIGPGALVEPGAYIKGPAWIGPETKVSQGAYLRGNVVTGRACTIGHATEAKNALFLDQAHAPHFAYVGDSVLGNRTNLGAGTKLSNVTVSSKKDPATGKRPTLRIRVADKTYDTGLEKFGAVLGDGAQTGCNAVLNPGTLLGREVLVYACASVRGYIPPRSIVKLRQTLQVAPRRV
ncbi:MAG TPA: glucose-1-phosphate thymidylyltransferase [Planctomycetes bacterium]|nr:glucose-1-phosphate thymidylyltransferase [Planctomycetota bacterium]